MEDGGPSRPNRQVKKEINADQQRRRRDQHLIEIRKKKVEEQAAKRRDIAPDVEDGGADGQSAGAASLVSAGDIARYADLVINGTTEEQKLEGAQSFRKLLSAEKNPPIDQVVAHGVLPYLVSFLSVDSNPKLQFEAAWSLTNVASGTSAHTLKVIEARAVEQFVRLLGSPHEDVREQATWALGNIAGDSPHCRDLVLSLGALHPIINIIQPTAKLSVLRNAVWTLSNLCRGKPAPDFRIVGHALPILAAVIHSADQDVLTDALWALSYLSDGPDERVAAVLEAGVLVRVVELLGHQQHVVVTPALRTIGNIVTGDETQTQAVLNAGVLPHLVQLMRSSRKTLRKEACWTVSNIMAGTQQQIQAVLDHNCIQVLVQILRGGVAAEADVRKEATWAICNGTSCGNRDQIQVMVQCGVVPLMLNQLNLQDQKLSSVILEGFENILRSGEIGESPVIGNVYVDMFDSADVFRTLQMFITNNQFGADCVKRADEILDRYWLEGEEEEEGEAPEQIEHGAGGFGGSFGGATGAPPAPGGGFTGFGSGTYFS